MEIMCKIFSHQDKWKYCAKYFHIKINGNNVQNIITSRLMEIMCKIFSHQD